MNQEKQIEEIANEIHKAEISFVAKCIKVLGNEDVFEKCVQREEHIAEHLYNADYRKQSEVAREIFEESLEHLRGLYDFFRNDDCIREASAIILAISDINELKKKYMEENK